MLCCGEKTPESSTDGATLSALGSISANHICQHYSPILLLKFDIDWRFYCAALALFASPPTRVVESNSARPSSGFGPRDASSILHQNNGRLEVRKKEREIESQLPWAGHSRGLAGTSKTKSHIGDEIGAPPRVLRLEWDGSKFGR